MAKSLYVGNLSYTTTEETLQELFAAYGEVSQVNVVKDRETGRSRGFAFVGMATDDAANAAIAALNGKMVDGRQLKVAEANPRPERRSGPPPDRERGGSRGGDRGWGRDRDRDRDRDPRPRR